MNTRFKDVFTNVCSIDETENRIFIKDMAQYIVRPDAKDDGTNPTVFTDDELRQMDHAFLIRTPKQAVPSYYRCCNGDSASKETSFTYYDPNEAGYIELKQLYVYLTKLFGSSRPLSIVDSDDLTSHPEAVLKKFCEANDIEWDETMTSWSAGDVSEFKTWPGFHKDVQKSTGFYKSKAYDDKHPQIVLDTIESNMPLFDFLHSRKLVI